MPRRDSRTQDGKVFASEWPEWHVVCAVEGCEESGLVAGLGECYTAREAEKIARKNAADDPEGKYSEMSGWTLSDGLWVCPKCSGKESE